MNGMIGGKKFDHLSRTFGSRLINRQLFRRSKNVDYAAKLFISEDGLITSDENIQNTLREIAAMKAMGIVVDGIAVHATFTEPPNGYLIRHRLNRLASAGLPIWITRYSYSHSDVAVRAQAFEDFMTAVRSNSMVGGVMLAGFWDMDMESGSSASFFDGSDVLPNAAGDTLRTMVSRDSHLEDPNVLTFSLGKKESKVAPLLTLEHGVYQLIVREEAEGKIIRRQYISLHKHEGDKSYTLGF